jgi:hypothetical protein
MPVAREPPSSHLTGAVPTSDCRAAAMSCRAVSGRMKPAFTAWFADAVNLPT